MVKLNLPRHIVEQLRPAETSKKIAPVARREPVIVETGDLKNYEHPVFILAEQVQRLTEFQALLHEQIRNMSGEDGILDVQMLEVYRRMSAEILKYIQEMRADWNLVIDDRIDEDALAALLDVEMLFEFLGEKAPDLIEDFMEYRSKKMLENTKNGIPI